MEVSGDIQIPKAREMKEGWGCAAVQQEKEHNASREIKEAVFQRLLYSLLVYCCFIIENYTEQIFQFIFTWLIFQPNGIAESVLVL